MGHANVGITQNVYTGTWWDDRKGAVQGISRIIWGDAEDDPFSNCVSAQQLNGRSNAIKKGNGTGGSTDERKAANAVCNENRQIESARE
jgi:hypothetical protein